VKEAINMMADPLDPELDENNVPISTLYMTIQKGPVSIEKENYKVLPDISQNFIK
jgi:hypothetical protein